MLATRALFLLLGILLLAGCTTTKTELPAAAGPASAQAMPAAPMERHQAAAQCWMKYDKVPNLDTKSKLVGTCIAEKTRGGAPAAR